MLSRRPGHDSLLRPNWAERPAELTGVLFKYVKGWVTHRMGDGPGFERERWLIRKTQKHNAFNIDDLFTHNSPARTFDESGSRF